MIQNILGINIYQAPPLRQIVQQIFSVLKKYSHQSHLIQIQFKYAQIIPSYPDNIKQSPQIRNKMYTLSRALVNQHYQSLKKLSYNGVIMLNNINYPNKIFAAVGGFDQSTHKRFYVIRQFLINLCKQNIQNKYKNNLNYYPQMQCIGLNKKLKIINLSQIRLDINIKQGQHYGRYSYLVGKGQQGWTRTRKQNIIRQQYDLMLGQRTFRLAVKRQQQISITFQQMLDILKINNINRSFIRFKRALRISKNNQVQIALSEIYQPQQERVKQCIEDIKMIVENSHTDLDQFCMNIFQEFYMWEPVKGKQNSNHVCSKFQIESQFLPDGIKKMQEFYANKQRTNLQNYLRVTLEDLYALYFIQHRIKSLESNIMAQIIKRQKPGVKEFAQCRLENQFGTYMHDYINQYMREKI